MKFLLLFCILKTLISAFIDKNGIRANIPDKWSGRWTLGDTAYKFKPEYLYSIGEGVIMKLSESEYNENKNYIKDKSVNNDMRGYKIDKSIRTIDIYGVSVWEYIALIKNGNTIYILKAYYEMSIQDEMEKGLDDILSSFLIKDL